MKTLSVDLHDASRPGVDGLFGRDREDEFFPIHEINDLWQLETPARVTSV